MFLLVLFFLPLVQVAASFEHPYPPTKVAFAPEKSRGAFFSLEDVVLSVGAKEIFWLRLETICGCGRQRDRRWCSAQRSIRTRALNSALLSPPLIGTSSAQPSLVCDCSVFIETCHSSSSLFVAECDSSLILRRFPFG